MAEPGFAGVAPGSGEIMIEPVSVCHQVSTMGQRFLPMASKYQLHAAGLMGSPTVPSRRRLEMSCGVDPFVAPGHESAHGGGGAVKNGDFVALDDFPEAVYAAAKSGAPSYITMLAPFESGP